MIHELKLDGSAIKTVAKIQLNAFSGALLNILPNR